MLMLTSNEHSVIFKMVASGNMCHFLTSFCGFLPGASYRKSRLVKWVVEEAMQMEKKSNWQKDLEKLLVALGWGVCSGQNRKVCR